MRLSRSFRLGAIVVAGVIVIGLLVLALVRGGPLPLILAVFVVVAARVLWRAGRRPGDPA